MMALRQLLSLRNPILLGKIHNLNSGLSGKNSQTFTNQCRYLRKRTTDTSKQGNRNYNSTPFEGYVEPNYINPDSIAKATLFTVAFSFGSFASVTIWEYERIRSRAINAIKNSNPMSWLKRRQTQQQQNDFQKEYERRNKELEELWSKLTPGQRVFFPILALNLTVYGLWRIPRLKLFMLNHFASNPASRIVCWPMFLSTFSHYSAFHLFANMYVLHSFTSAVNTLGQEQFVGMYMAAGVFSSLTSYLYKFAIKAPGFSLGASGAIMCVIAYVCSSFPDTRLQIIFLPQFNFSAENALQGVMLFDLAGVIFRWKLFDHAAHLGGACFGLFWSQYGHHIWPKREYIVGYWHQLRGKTK